MKKPLFAVALFALCAAFAFAEPQPVPGASLAEQFAWLRAHAASNTQYLIPVSASETIAPQELIPPPGRSNISVTLRGNGAAHTISLDGDRSLFTVGPRLTLILDENITLQGHLDNNTYLVRVNNGGRLIMNAGSGITGNTGGGVGVNSGGVFTMNGGAIWDNTGSTGAMGGHAKRGRSGGTGGVSNWGAFTMYGGTISGNTGGAGYSGDGDALSRRGGIGGVSNWGVFTMNGGEISGNSGGAGVGGNLGGSGGVFNSSVFAMHGGTISGNSGGAGGYNRWGIIGGIGGVNNSGRFTLYGGEISGNSGGAGTEANGTGTAGWGGVGGVSNWGVFAMNGGIISGNTGNAAESMDVAASPWLGWNGVGAVFNSGAFTMNGGEISGNSGGIAIWSVRHGVTSYGVFRITNGIIYGNDAPPELGNPGGTLRIFGTGPAATLAAVAQRGIFNSVGLFVSAGNISSTDNTIHVVDGILQ